MQLLHAGAHQAGVGPEAVDLRRVAEQGQHPVADQVHGGLEAGHEQQGDGAEQLGVGEPVALGLGRDQGAEQVGAGVAPALLDQVGEVPEQLHAGGHALHEGGLVEVVVEQAGRARGPALEALPVGHRHAQQLADHHRRQRVGQVGQHVELAVAPLHHRVEQLVDQPLDAGLEAVDGARGERLADQAPQPGVVGRVEEHHQVRPGLAHRALLRQVDALAQPGRVGAEPRVAQHGGGVVVAGEHPRAVGGVVDGLVAADEARRSGTGCRGSRAAWGW